MGSFESQATIDPIKERIAAEWPFMLRVAMKFARNKEIAEDIAGDALAAALANPPEYQGDIPLRGWLRTRVQWTYGQWRQKKENQLKDEVVEELEVPQAWRPLSQEQIAEVGQFLARISSLPARERVVMEGLLMGNEIAEIAREMNEHEQTVIGLAHSARKRLGAL